MTFDSQIFLDDCHYLNRPPGFDAFNYAYGDNNVAAVYSGFRRTPFYANGEWQHGVILREANCEPNMVIGSDGLSHTRRGKRYFVARSDQHVYLQGCGFTNVHVVGLPIIYVNAPQVKRQAGTLLVMPTHSLPELPSIGGEDRYVNFILALKRSFSRIVVCLHRTCFDKTEWRSKFESNKIQVLRGADPDDKYTYFKLAELFSKVEFMTTNGFGSHVPYAAYFGCKVSISGPVQAYDRSQFSNVPLYKNNPSLLQWREKVANEIRQNYGFLYTDPENGRSQRDWAAETLGVDNKRTPVELRELFGWDLRSRLRRKIVANFQVVMATAGNCARSLRKRSNPGG